MMTQTNGSKILSLDKQIRTKILPETKPGLLNALRRTTTTKSSASSRKKSEHDSQANFLPKDHPRGEEQWT
jgi:hypothetical protein